MLARPNKSGWQLSASRILARLRDAINDNRSFNQGRRNEQRALLIATEMHIAGLIPHTAYGDPRRPYLTEPYSPLDRRGIDLVVPTNFGDIGLQIKSSKYGKRKFVQHYLDNKERIEWIPCIVVNPRITDDKVREKIRRQTWRKYYELQER